MERIIIVNRTSKTDGTMNLRFRLMDSGKLELFHSPGVKVNVKDLSKFEVTGELKPRVTVYNKELAELIKTHIAAMHRAYRIMVEKGMDMNTATFEQMIDQQLNPIQQVRSQSSETFVERFIRFVDTAFRDGVIGDRRQIIYLGQVGKMQRFLAINGLSEITPPEFDEELLMKYRQFLYDEYLYVPKYKRIYKDVAKRFIPMKRLSTNTVVGSMKIWQTFFTELENRDEIHKSPFRKLGKDKRKSIMHMMFDDPVFLRQDEFQKVLTADVPESLSSTRDWFVLQCALGCRLGDFSRLTMDNVAVSEDGIPYVHYLPHKTARTQDSNTEIKTPLVHFALDKAKRTWGQGKKVHIRLYNYKIRELMKHCGIDRKVEVYDEATQTNNYIPLYEAASSKLARKTHVDMMNKVQVNIYAAGLHREGSDAVYRYTKMELADRFALMNVAFGQKDYRVNSKLEEI